MSFRWVAVRAAAVLALMAPLLVLPPAASPAAEDTVRVRGTYQQLAAVGRGTERVRHAIRTGRATYWLRLPGGTDLRTGDVVAVTGRRVDANTIAVTGIRPLAEARATSARTAREHRILVMRAYWTQRKPARPTTRQTRTIWLTKSKRWFREVSHGRYTVTGKVTPWLRIERPASCTESAFRAMDAAKRQARRAGFRLRAFDRFLLYMPCNGRGTVGLGSMLGANVWQFGSLQYDVAVHEQGHNLGLVHANIRECVVNGRQVTWAGSRACTEWEYEDGFDVMGNRSAGHFSATFKKYLGWLQRMTTMSASGTRTLSPYETTGPGLKAIRVAASRSRVYWLEYRTKRGVDAGFPAGSFGIHIRAEVRGARGPQLLDALPGSGSRLGGGPGVEWDRVALPPLSSWTTPEGIRISVLGQDVEGAQVSVRFGAPAPSAPDAPTGVTAAPVADGVKVSWAKPFDNGAVITRYVVTPSDGKPVTVRSVGGDVTTATVAGVDPAVTQSFSVQAVNQAGTSARGTATSTSGQ